MWLIRFFSLFMFLYFGIASAQDKVDYGTMLNRLKNGCSNYASMMNYQDLAKLNSKTTEEGISPDFAQYMAFSGIDWVPLAKETSCKFALLENEIQGMRYYIKNQPSDAYMHNTAKLNLAKAMMIQVLLQGNSEKNPTFNEAEALVYSYLELDDDSFEPGKSMAYYFAAHAYIDSSQYATQKNEQLFLLEKAIYFSKEGLKKAKNKESILEPLGISLGKKGQLFSKTSSEHNEILKESIEAFKAGNLNDKINLYNIAASYTQLGDIEKSKIWLLKIEQLKDFDKQLCVQGLLTDPDLNLLRTQQNEWFIGYMQRNCMEQVKAVILDMKKS